MDLKYLSTKLERLLSFSSQLRYRHVNWISERKHCTKWQSLWRQIRFYKSIVAGKPTARLQISFGKVRQAIVVRISHMDSCYIAASWRLLYSVQIVPPRNSASYALFGIEFLFRKAGTSAKIVIIIAARKLCRDFVSQTL